MGRLSDRDKRTLRIGAALVVIYLVIFYGVAGLRWLESGRSEYQRLLLEAQNLRTKMQQQENKRLRLEKLSRGADLATFNQATLVNQVSAAIRNAAQAEGVKLGPIREVSGSAKGKEAAAMQLEVFGPLPGAMTLLHRLETMEYPVVVDSLEINPDARQPGTIKLNVRIVVIDFGKWQTEERRDV